MNKHARLSSIFSRLLASGALLAAMAGPASATLAHYYYDTQGRLLGALSSGFEQRTSQTDAADNPSYLHVFYSSPDPGANTLGLYGVMIADQTLASTDGRFTFTIEENGNATIYENKTTVIWSTYTAPVQPGWFTVGGDGNIYFKGPDDSIIWKTNVSNSTPNNVQLIMQSTGDLELFQNGVMVWNTNTGGH